MGYFNSKRIEFTTGYRIDVAKWEEDKQRVKLGCINKLKQSASEINTNLLRYYTDIQNIFKEFEVKDIMPSPAQLKEAYNALYNYTETKSETSVYYKPLEVFAEFIKECGAQSGWSHATYEKFASVAAMTCVTGWTDKCGNFVRNSYSRSDYSCK